MRIILLSPRIAKGEEISYLFCSQSGWVAISEKDKDEMYLEKELKEFNPEEFQILTEEELLSRIPSLRGKLKEEDEKFITIDRKNGRVYVNPLHKTKSVFTDTSSRATNQANFTADTWTYVINRKKHYLKIVLITILLLIASYIISWGIIVLVFWIVFYEYFSTIASIDNYKMGTLNASIVITVNPTRIAVLTDVSMGIGKYPLVRVCRLNLPSKYNQLNERIPSSCGYQNCEDQFFWDFVMPNPIVYATHSEDAIKQKLTEIPTQDWVDLQNWIRSNRHNFIEGYYPVRNEESNWGKHETPIFTSFGEEKRPEHNK